MPSPDLFATVEGRVRHLAYLAGLKIDALSILANLSPRTLSSIAGNSINGNTAKKVAVVCGMGEEERREVEGWITAGVGEVPHGDKVRAAVAAALQGRA